MGFSARETWSEAREAEPIHVPGRAEPARPAAQIAVHLAAQPTTAVTVTATSADPTALSVAPGSLTFTPANYATDQYVTVTGGNVALGRYVDVTFASTGLTDAMVSVAVIKAATFMKASFVRGRARLDELHVAARDREHVIGLGARRARR